MPGFASKEVADLIAGMLTTDPAQRLKLSEIREHSDHLDEEILEQLDSYGFPREYAVKCLRTNKHNHVTTTYHLIREKQVRAAAEGKRVTSQVIADLDATGVEE